MISSKIISITRAQGHVNNTIGLWRFQSERYISSIVSETYFSLGDNRYLSSSCAKYYDRTRMHSSRMRTGRSLTVMHAGLHTPLWRPAARHAGIPPAMHAAIHTYLCRPAARHAGIPPAMHAGIHTPSGDLLQGMLGYLLQCMLGYTPLLVNRMTNRCKNIRVKIDDMNVSSSECSFRVSLS